MTHKTIHVAYYDKKLKVINMSLVSSPLRYPGGKAELCEYIENVIKVNDLCGCEFYEPFAGGASASIALLQKGIITKAVLIEKDPLIYSFWKSVFEHTEDLCTLIDETRIDIDTWNELKKYRSIEIPVSTMIPVLGFAGLFFNRTNFSGILDAGPIGGQSQEGKYKINCRFNKNRLIDIISFISLYKDRVEVVWSDAISYLKNSRDYLLTRNSFAYIDPPYYDKGKSLYRHYFENKDHCELANLLKNCNFPWLLSYDNCVFINDLYNGKNSELKRRTLYFDYSVRTSKKGKEILVSNLEIPPIEHASFAISEM